MQATPAPATDTGPDAELSALGKCCRLLEALSPDQRARVLWWLVDRHFGADAVEAAKARLAAGA
jgi:hypothetical protein